MRTILFLMCLFIPTASESLGAEPFRYKAGEHGRGKLSWVNGIPVLILQGSPEEMGEQTGVLAVKQAKAFLKFPYDYFLDESTNEILRKNPKWTRDDTQFKLASEEVKLLWPQVQKKATSLEQNFPKTHLAELNAIIKHAAVDRRQLVSTNGLFDLGHMPQSQLFLGCSSLIIPPELSATKGLLFGRNLDFPHFGYLHQYSLLMVCRSDDPKKHSFASAGFPGFVGSFTGMNDAGLTIASHEVDEPITTTLFNPKGVPFAMAYRRVLEECTTVGESLKLLDGMERASITSLVIADTEGGAVIEVTPDSLAVRRFKDKPGICTNHFCVMKNPKQSNNWETLDRFKTLSDVVKVKQDNKFEIRDIKKALHDVRQFDANKTDITIQSFVFEPATRKVHLRFADGKGPATAGEFSTLDLNKLWGK